MPDFNANVLSLFVVLFSFSNHVAQRLRDSLLFYLCTCRSHDHCASLSSPALLSWSSSSITYASFKCPSVHHFIHLKHSLICVFCWFLLIVVPTFVFKETACLFSFKWPLNTPEEEMSRMNFFICTLKFRTPPPHLYVRVCFSSLWRLFLCNVADCLFLSTRRQSGK